MILRDVTQRREMLDSLIKAERFAAAGTWGAGVAPEVNNPLASISSLVQSILTGENDPERRTTMHTILSQITRISSTLKDLVNFARPTTAQRKQVDVNGLIAETLRFNPDAAEALVVRDEPQGLGDQPVDVHLLALRGGRPREIHQVLERARDARDLGQDGVHQG